MSQLFLSGPVPSLTVGGRVFTDIANLIVLYAYNSGGANRYSGFNKMGVGAAGAYQVTAGKTLYIHAIRINQVTAVVAQLSLFQNDAAYAFSSSAVVTNAVFFEGPSEAANGMFNTTASAGANTEYACYGRVAAAKYLAMDQNTVAGGMSVFAFGYES